MEQPNVLLDFLLHSDRHLLDFVRAYGSWVYGWLFVIVFAETGFVVTPFLPGDSLLFAAGALCATGALSAPATFVFLAVAAFTGNAVNYTVGRLAGPRVFSATDSSGISHPATMTHASVPAERRAALGITDGMVRISVGIEDIDDLKEDLSQALDRV